MWYNKSREDSPRNRNQHAEREEVLFYEKIAPILLAMVLALTLCLVGFADAESYDDDPLEETAASTSEEALEEAEPVPARSSECDACGKMSRVTPKKTRLRPDRRK